jgi:hypothetical protein
VTRIEPVPRDGGIQDGLAARVHDPLWLLARQWQLGEFRGDDSGSPVEADVSASTHQVDAWRAGSGDWQPWDPAATPLEQLVEQEGEVRAADPALRRDGGARWLRALAASASAGSAFLAGCPWPTVPGELEPTGLAAVLQSKVPDGAAVATSLRALTTAGTADAEAARLGLSAADRATVEAAAPAWLAWWGGQVPAGDPVQPGPPVTWDPHRLEHAFAVRSSTLPGTELTATAYLGGSVDWPSVDAAPPGQVPAQPETPGSLPVKGVPMPARFGGMPAARFWEMEDAQFDPGSVDAAPHDLARLLLVSFVTVYGNDWCVVPVRLPVGTLVKVDTFTVTDVFGGTTTLGPAAADDPDWNLFALTDDREASGASPWFWLAPTLPDSLEGPVTECVLFARDEMANLAWAVELRVGGRDRYEAWLAREPAPLPPDPFPRYQVDTVVPSYWFPLAPEQNADQESVRLRLVPLARRAAGALDLELPLGELLADARSDRLWLFEEEVPRSGTRVARRRQRARWHDGSVHAWTARRRESGTGESSSGLTFDSVTPPTA